MATRRGVVMLVCLSSEGKSDAVLPPFPTPLASVPVRFPDPRSRRPPAYTFCLVIFKNMNMQSYVCCRGGERDSLRNFELGWWSVVPLLFLQHELGCGETQASHVAIWS
jgi:hypothetical protein